MSMDGETAEFPPSLRFDSDDPEFCRGFEVASIWAKLQGEPEVAMDFYMHDTNIEMAMRIAESLNREVRSTELNDNWLMVLFSASGKMLEETEPSEIRHY